MAAEAAWLAEFFEQSNIISRGTAEAIVSPESPS